MGEENDEMGDFIIDEEDVDELGWPSKYAFVSLNQVCDKNIYNWCILWWIHELYN